MGRSLLGAVHRVAGVELLINKAEPELVRWKTGEVISLRPAARLCESRGFSWQELYLRGGDSDFRHTGKQKIGQDSEVEDTEGGEYLSLSAVGEVDGKEHFQEVQDDMIMETEDVGARGERE